VVQQQQHNPIEQVLELLTEQGADGFAESVRLLLNLAMLFEREYYLQAAPYERTLERRDYANGFKSKRLRAWATSTCASRRCARATSIRKRLNAVDVASGW
jgi:hypothetical protein